MAHHLPRGSQAGGAHDGAQIVDGSCKVLIHNNIIEVTAVAHFFPRSLESAQDDLRRVLPGRSKAGERGGEGGG